MLQSLPLSSRNNLPEVCFLSSSAGDVMGCLLLNRLPLPLLGVHHGKPTLSALPSPVVTPGGNVTLKCVSSKGYDWFILTGADQNFSRSQKAQFIRTGQSLALFPEITVASSKSGPFRCYGYYANTLYVWSKASDPLEIRVSGKEVSFTQLFGTRNPLL